MTEYDYSPEGYERYLATQNRVSNWVQSQNHRMQKYTNPYTTRAMSTPPVEHTHRSSSRDRSHHQAVPRSMHSSHTQPTYYQPIHYVAPSTAYPQPTTYRTYQYDGSTREIVLPPPRAGESYVIIPPKGRRVEVIQDPYLGSRSTSSKSSSRSPTSPTKKGQGSVLKRLFTGFGGGQPAPSAKLSRSSSTSRRQRTRSY